jgi:uncharacterized protein YecE (DUF72 family)
MGYAAIRGEVSSAAERWDKAQVPLARVASGRAEIDASVGASLSLHSRITVGGQLRIGTQGWNYAAWVGPFYPEGTRPQDMLTRYAEAFATVEVDSTFYATPPSRTVERWGWRVPAGFTFSLKLPSEITHQLRLVNAEAETALFLERARLLGDRLAVILVQLGPDFHPDEFGALASFVARLPADLRFAVELRNARWMRPEVRWDLLGMLAEAGVALALSDGRWIPREVLLELALRPTAGFHYLRWMGPNRDLTDFSRLQVDREEEIGAWSAVLRAAGELPLDIFGYVNNHFAGHAPASARELQRRLGQHAVDPREIGEQTSLF